MASEFGHQDVIQIIIRDEQAREALQNLLRLLNALDVRLREISGTLDSAFTQIAGPLKAIEVSTATTVSELRLLRQELGNLGAAGAGARMVATDLQTIGAAAREVQAQIAMTQARMTVPALPPGVPPRVAGAEQMGPAGWEPAPARPAIELGAILYGAPGGQIGRLEDWQEYVRTSRALKEAMRELGVEVDTGTGRWSRYNISFMAHAGWLLRAMILYQMLGAAMNVLSDLTTGTINIMTEFDTTLARIGFITQRTEADLISMSGTVADLAVSYGQMPTEVFPAWQMASQATKDQAESLLLLEDANKLALMGQMDTATALQKLVAIERQWGLEASEGTRILDILAAGYRTGLIDINSFSDALARGGPLAKSLGVSFEEFAGIIVATAEQTELSGREAINFWERISQRMFAPEAAQQLWEKFRIGVYQPGAPEERRAPIEVLREIASIWDNINGLTGKQLELEQSNLALILSGRAGMGGYLAETIAVLNAWDKIERPIQAAGQSQELIAELQETLAVQINQMRGDWQRLRIELGLYFDALGPIKDFVGDIRDILAETIGLLRTAREEQVSAPVAWIGQAFGLSPEQMQQAQRWYAQYMELIEPGMEAAFPWERPLRLGPRREAEEELYTPMPEGWGPEMWEYGRAPGAVPPTAVPGIAPPPYPYNLQILEAEELTWQDIIRLQDESIARVEEVILANQALYETEAERKWIADEIRKTLQDQVVLLRDQEGILHAVRGEGAAYLQDLMREQETLRDMGVQRMRDFSPEMLQQVVGRAAQWQQWLATLGFTEQARQMLLIGQDPSFWLMFEGSLTALRLAVEDLTEIERQQLQGQWNLPAGAVAWVPITSLWYQRQAGTGGLPALPETGAPETAGAGGFFAPRGIPPEIAKWWDYIQEASQTYGLDPLMLAAVMKIESGGRPGAISPAGAVGLGQIMPREAGFPERPTTAQLLDPHFNVMYMASMLGELLQEWQDPLKAAAGYFGALSPTGQITGAMDVGGVSGFGYVELFKQAYAAMQDTGMGLLPQAALQPTINIPPIEIPTIHAEFTIRNVIILEGRVVQDYVSRLFAQNLATFRRSGGTSGAGGPSRVQ